MKKYVVGNWKMNMDVKSLSSFAESLPKDSQPYKCESWIAPQFIHIERLLSARVERPYLHIGSQNCASEPSGAFTGETSPRSLLDIGVTFTLVGHSERRQYYNEDNELLNKKTLLALREGLKVIFCIGETLDQREANQTESILTQQLREGLKEIPEEQRQKIIVAYEPVWAIGTGKTATPEMAQEAHKHVRGVLTEIWGETRAKETPILYGGSVKPDNAEGLFSQQDIDGGLVGGASLKAEDFITLCEIGSKLS